MLPNNTIERFKARLVARGFSQVPGLEYDESMTHSPVVRHTTLRAVLAHAAQANWPVHQWTCHMQMWPQINGNNWNRHIDAWFKSQGFTPSDADPCMYSRHSADGKVVFIVCLYVDDLLITGPILTATDAFKVRISLAFPMKDLGVLNTS
ncbi:unnamed protein product [Phaeothamnion confervicola]